MKNNQQNAVNEENVLCAREISEFSNAMKFSWRSENRVTQSHIAYISNADKSRITL